MPIPGPGQTNLAEHVAAQNSRKERDHVAFRPTAHIDQLPAVEPQP
jgi:hypothetical protein